jgi:hypothetical protein
METEEIKPLVNTIPEDEPIVYEVMPAGTQVCALVGLKNKVRKNHFTEEDNDGYQLSFRSRENPNAFVVHWCKASKRENSNLFKLLRNMTDGKIKKDATSEEVFVSLVECVDKWFKVRIEHRKKEQGEGVWVNIADNYVVPHDLGSQWGLASQFFGNPPAVEAVSILTPEEKAKKKAEENLDKDEIPW